MSDAAFHLRPARPADLAALVALEQSTFSYDRMSARQLRHHLHNPAAALLLAEDAHGLLGAALLLFRRGSLRARLYSLATAAAARGRGIGAALLAAAERAAAARGATQLRLEVRQDNAAAVQLYESRGYRRIATLDGYYDDGAGGWRFEKQLTGIPP